MSSRNKNWSLLLVLLILFPVVAWARNDFNTFGSDFEAPWYLGRVAQHIFAALLGGLFGAFFSEKMRSFRRWILLGLLLLVALSLIRGSVTLGNIVFFIIGALVAYRLLRETVKIIKNRPKPETTIFGSAKWATLEHLQTNELIGEEGFTLGSFIETETNHPLHYTGDRHLLTVAPTRSGKGVSSIIPNLLTYEGSAIIIDPKGENAQITAARRGKGDPELKIQGMGQDVHVVDPWFITGLPCSRFNPLDWLNLEDPDINENAMMLADSIVTPHTGNRDQFWDEEAKALLMGILLYVALDEREQDARTLGRVRDIITLGSEELNAIFLQMVESPNPIVRSTAQRTVSKEEKLKSNVLASLQAHTHFLDSPRIRESLEVSDFKFEDLKASKMTVYLVLPADRLEPFGRWLRLLIQQALTVNARNIAIKPEKPVLFLLDEMASLGRLTMVEQAYSLMAGFGMQLWGIVQDLSQLDRIYDKGWETFIGNSGVLQYFGSRDHKTAEYFSKLCGVTTVEKFSFARTIARAFGRSASSSSGEKGYSLTSGSSQTTTYSDTDTIDVVQRNLIFPDELMVLRERKQIVLIENFNPIQARKRLWYKDESLKTMGVDLNRKEKATSTPTEPLKKELIENEPTNDIS